MLTRLKRFCLAAELEFTRLAANDFGYLAAAVFVLAFVAGLCLLPGGGR